MKTKHSENVQLSAPLRSNKNDPIGIFDSGIGGLTVANAISKVLPGEKIIYFGDTAHLPYGDKSSESIRHYSIKITDFLLQKKCKIILIACNTASSVAYKTVKQHVGNKAIVINVIDPVVLYVTKNYSGSKIGVIGTKGTINSRVYVKKITKLNKTIKVTSLATPLLAPMIEEGFFNNYISKTIINAYLSKKTFKDIKAIILGCTHYPLIKKEIQNYYLQNTEVIDSAEIVALYTSQVLNSFSPTTQLLFTRGGDAPTGKSGKNIMKNIITNQDHQFFVSDYTQSFEKSTKFFFKNKIQLKKVQIW